MSAMSVAFTVPLASASQRAAEVTTVLANPEARPSVASTRAMKYPDLSATNCGVCVSGCVSAAALNNGRALSHHIYANGSGPLSGSAEAAELRFTVPFGRV